jgi:hypothetical protein
MADLNINDLSGSELFNDSENFLSDLDEQETNDVIGGYANIGISVSVQTNVGNSRNANSFFNFNTVAIG